MGWCGRALEGSSFIERFEDSPDILDVIYESSVGVKHLCATTSSFDLEGDRGVLVVVRDVLDVKRMEREMFQAGKMTASVAH